MGRAPRRLTWLALVAVSGCVELVGGVDVPIPEDGGTDGGHAGSGVGPDAGAGHGASGGEGSSDVSDASNPESSDVLLPPGDSSPADVAPSVDAAQDAPAGSADAALGPTCGPLGTGNRCPANQVCCANPSTQVNTCASSCPAADTLACSVPTDCPGFATFCCAHLTLSGGTPPSCTESALSASCAATCDDEPPADTCTFTGTVRLCAHDQGCDFNTSGGLCFNFNNAPVSWCTTMAIGTAGGGVEQK